MKKYYTAIILLIALMYTAIAFAGNDCAAIQDPNQRAYCRAVATNSRGNCSAISDYNFRQQCNARLGAPVTPTCSSVPIGWQREACKDAARARR